MSTAGFITACRLISIKLLIYSGEFNFEEIGGRLEFGWDRPEANRLPDFEAFNWRRPRIIHEATVFQATYKTTRITPQDTFFPF